jgi:hypothetical protein
MSTPPTNREKIVLRIKEKLSKGQGAAAIAKDLELSRAYTAKIIKSLQPPPHP